MDGEEIENVTKHNIAEKPVHPPALPNYNQITLIHHCKEILTTTYHYDYNNEIETTIFFVPQDSIESFDYTAIKNSLDDPSKPVILDLMMSRVSKETVRYISICLKNDIVYVLDIPEIYTEEIEIKKLVDFLTSFNFTFVISDKTTKQSINCLEKQLNLVKGTIKITTFFDFIYTYYRKNKKEFHKYFQPLLGQEMFHRLLLEVNEKLDHVCSTVAENRLKHKEAVDEAEKYFDKIAEQTDIDGIKEVLRQMAITDATLHRIGEEIEYQERIKTPRKHDLAVLDIIKNLLTYYLKETCLCNLKLKLPPWLSSIHEYYVKTSDARTMYSRDRVTAEEYDYTNSFTKDSISKGEMENEDKLSSYLKSQKRRPWDDKSENNKFASWLSFTLPRLGFNAVKYYYLCDIERIENFITSSNSCIKVIGGPNTGNGFDISMYSVGEGKEQEIQTTDFADVVSSPVNKDTNEKSFDTDFINT